MTVQEMRLVIRAEYDLINSGTIKNDLKSHGHSLQADPGLPQVLLRITRWKCALPGTQEKNRETPVFIHCLIPIDLSQIVLSQIDLSQPSASTISIADFTLIPILCTPMS